MRTAFIKTLEAIASEDSRINLVVGDLGFSVVENFAKRFPSQFLNAGVAEQNMTGLAAGMALSGKIVFTYSIANFPTLRCLEQIRNDVCYHKADVKIVSVGGGLAYGALGSSHQATEDLAILRALPDMTVIAPGDPVEAEYATRAVAKRQGPCYLRLGKAGEPKVHQGPIDFQIGKALTLRDGHDLTIITTGAMLHDCVKAADQLEASGVSVRLLSMHTIKPLDRETILFSAAHTRAILSVEEHSIFGGLGGSIAEVLAQSAKSRVPFRILGLDGFCRVVGSQDYLRAASGLSVGDIVRSGQELLNAAPPNA
jgi:transketolase